MIIGMQQISHKITYPYQVDNVIDYDSNQYIIKLGSISNNISGFMKYKLIDKCNGDIVERIVLSDHQLILRDPNTFTQGIFPLYSNKLNSPEDPQFFFDEGVNNSIYLDYINFIQSQLNDKRCDKSVSIQEFFIDSIMTLLNVALQHYILTNEVRDYCVNNMNYLKNLSNNYRDILYMIGIHSANASTRLIDFLTDSNNFDESNLHQLVSGGSSCILPDINSYNTFEQIDVYQNRQLNHFILEVLNNRNIMVEQGINLLPHIDRNIRMLDNNSLLKYTGLFDLNSENIEFSFPKNYRIVINNIISFLQTRQFGPSVIGITRSRGLEVLDSSLHSNDVNAIPVTDDLMVCINILHDHGVNNMKIMVTNEEDMYIMYNDSMGHHNVYIDLVLWSLVGFSNISYQTVF